MAFWSALVGSLTAMMGAFAANIVAGALVGAVIGGVTAAITGGNIGKGLLFGAIGGAVSGGLAYGLGGASSGGVTAVAAKNPMVGGGAQALSASETAAINAAQSAGLGGTTGAITPASKGLTDSGFMKAALAQGAISTGGDIIAGIGEQGAQEDLMDWRTKESALDREQRTKELRETLQDNAAARAMQAEIAAADRAELRRQFDVQLQKAEEKRQRAANAVSSQRLKREPLEIIRNRVNNRISAFDTSEEEAANA